MPGVECKSAPDLSGPPVRAVRFLAPGDQEVPFSQTACKLGGACLCEVTRGRA